MATPTFGCRQIPVVIKWGGTERYDYIGTRIQNLRMNINLGSEMNPQLLFWFNVTIAVTASPESSKTRSKSLYFVVQGSLLENDTSLLLETPNSDCSLETGIAIREAGIGSDHTSVSRICFQLHNHGTVFMPSIEKHAFTPASDNVLQLLASMHSLSQAKQFWVYVSSEGSRLTTLWKRVDRIRKGPFTSDFTTQSIYKDSMVCDKWMNFNNFVRQENPAKHQSTLGEKHNSDPPPQYQGTGIRKDNDRLYEPSGGVSGKDLSSHDLDQQLIETESDEELETESDEELHLERKRKYSKISSNITPSGILKNTSSNQGSKVRFTEVPDELEEQLAAFIKWVLEIDLHLEKDCEQIFSDLGGAVSCGDVAKFNTIKSDCMANIYVRYIKTGSKWILRKLAEP